MDLVLVCEKQLALMDGRFRFFSKVCEVRKSCKKCSFLTFQIVFILLIFKFLQYVKCEPPCYNRQCSSTPFMPTALPPDSYGPPPATPSNSYGLPVEYGPPPSSMEVETPAPIIHKHVYIHIPPPEPDYSAPEVPMETIQPVQKHYRIIFIKAPTMSVPTSAQLPAIQAVTEEKTIVYVLVKKPDNSQPITTTAPITTPPSKPEVYFIRYRTQERTTTSIPDVENNGNGGYY